MTDVAQVAKAELHVHLEGTARPALVRRIAERNALALPEGLFADEDTFAWKDFLDFLRSYDLAASVIRTGEAEERRFVEPLGYLALYMTTLGYRIVPTVARVAPGFTLTLNPQEVDDAFEVPLAFLMAEENHKLHSREWKGMMRTVYYMPFGERHIWGVTAGILRNLYERIYRE